MFNWLQFLQSYNIQYIDKGSYVSKGNVNICCPFCDYDEKYYLGISLDNKGYGCWWSSSHRGKNPVRLVQALLKCSYQEAARICGDETVLLPDSQSFEETISSLLSEEFNRGSKVFRAERDSLN